MLDGVGYVDECARSGTHRGDPDAGPSVQLEMIDFGDTELKALAHLSDQRAYQQALLLERMHRRAAGRTAAHPPTWPSVETDCVV